MLLPREVAASTGVKWRKKNRKSPAKTERGFKEKAISGGKLSEYQKKTYNPIL